MRSSRREFLQIAAATAATIGSWRNAFAFYQSPGTPIPGTKWPGIGKYQTFLRGVGPGGIPVAAPDPFAAPVTGATHYSIGIGQYTDQLHPSLGPTTLWGYNPARALGGGVQPQKHLGGIIVAKKGVPTQVTFTNRLPSKHPLPVDMSTLFGDAASYFGNGRGPNAASTHLHGGFVPWISDGGPYHWFDPYGNYGPSIANVRTTLNPGLLPGQTEVYYPNQQSARLMWYHDHAHDIPRLNAYAGIASAYIIRDDAEGNLRNAGLPDFIENGGREIPFVVQDKIFVGPDIAMLDPTWPGLSTVGSLWYPHVYEKNRWRFTGNLAMPDPSIVPEMFGDTMLVNGTVFPVATVEARRYRFRLLNACQARFLNLQLYVADASKDGITYNNKGVPVNAPGPRFTVIGAEGGFLPQSVNVPAVQSFTPAMLTNGLPSMLAGPAERSAFIVDFSGFAGQSIIVYTDAPAPFPMGDPRNDYYAGNANGVTTKPGFGPDTRILMRFDVVGATSADPPLGITPSMLTAGLDPFLVPPGVAVQNGAVNLPPSVPIRQLTLNEGFDVYGRLIQLLGTNTALNAAAFGFGRAYDSQPTETPAAGATEVWQIANLRGDTHPIHFHLVNVQVLARQPFDVKRYAGTPVYIGPAR